MYTIENNINTLQDVVKHINELSRVEAVLSNKDAIFIAYKASFDEKNYYCFNDNKILPHCLTFLNKATTAVLKNNDFYSDLCWAGIRLSVHKITVKSKIIYLWVDEYLLDTDTNGINESEAIKIGCNSQELVKIQSIYDNTAVLSLERLNELVELAKKCLLELEERNILDEEVEKNGFYL